ncbi:MAG: pyrroline-5-carboxylate reductase family protein, partial [Eggerthella lenta]
MADTTSSIELGFIGFGNMAQAMAQGLVDSDALSGEHIHACAGHFDKLKATAGRLGVNAYREAAEVVRASDFVVLAVKPYLVEQVVEPVRDLLADKAVISVAAGRDFAFYEGVLAPNSRHLSTIPNTPIAVG